MSSTISPCRNTADRRFGMGLFSRFKRAVKSNINDMISKSENPEKMLNQLIIDMNEQLIDSKKTVAAAIADEKKLERRTMKSQTAITL